MKIEDVLKSPAMTVPKQIIMNIMFTHTMVSEHFYEILKVYELSTEQFNVLRILRGQKGKPANMCVIQERMIAKTSNTTRLVDKLLLKGLVSREVCSDNRRKMEIAITPKGLELLKELDPKIEQQENGLADKLTPAEQEQFIVLMEKLRT